MTLSALLLEHLPILHLVQIKVSHRVIVFIPDPQHTFFDLPNNMAFPDLFWVPLSNLGLDHDKLIFDILLINLRLDLLAILFIINSFVCSILLSVFLKVDVPVLHDMKLLHVIKIILIFSFLVLYEICTFQEVILDPILPNIESKRYNDHDPNKFKEWMRIKNRENRDPYSDDLICEIVLSRKHNKLRNGRNHNPDHQLNEPYLIVNMLIQVLIGIPINVLCIVDRKIDSRLENQDIIFLGEVDHYRMDHVAYQNAEKYFAKEVHKVPVTPISFVYF